MPIEDSNVAVGTKLVAKYKGKQYICLVEAAESGDGLVYTLQGGKTRKSPSSAGMEVMGGKAVNGWRFWSVAGSANDRETDVSGPEAGSGHAKKVLYRLPNQKGIAEGKSRWFCNACMSSFLVNTGDVPEACPAGHRRDVP